MAEFTVAHKRVDITPTAANGQNPWMSGYGWKPRGNRHYVVNRSLHADCAVLQPDSGNPLIMVRVDVVSVPSFIYRRLRDHVVSMRKTDEASFLLVSSHTHSGPALPREPDPYSLFGLTGRQLERINAYGEWLINELIKLIDRTAAEPGVGVILKYGVGEERGISVNRTGLSWVLDDVQTLVAYRDRTNTPELALLGFACHPVSWGEQPVYDTDYPGVATQVLENSLECPVMFFTGCAGDQNPYRNDGDAAVVEIGTRIGNAALTKINSGLSPVSGPVRTVFRRVQLPLAVNLADCATRAGVNNRYGQEKAAAEARGDLPVARFCEVMQAELADVTSPTVVSLPVQYWKFGTDFGILALGGEVLSGYHVGLHRLVQDSGVRLWVMAYADEIPCYIPADDVLWHSGDARMHYESGWVDDPTFTGFYTSLMAYGWPVPLASSQPVGTSPATPESAEGRLMATCRNILGR
ncbi:hypothetical protein JOF56_003869 [Kibdelosporangium banguiense]|uniref:Ceramidase n=1 Tax=Kibdelosporangium banguiense TaxID=1365924 RepID=A0ABS4THK5_9PSEU|nr:hypothetical protein [Kibdelosporangium banguiense]MBP2323484.1 hypothetical protein [Kibdelosporangium banguiense]